VTRFAIVPAAYLLFMRGEGAALEVLLQQRGPDLSFRPGHWATAAAGHVEPGESVFAAGAREALEELGVVVDPEDITPLCAMQRTLPGVRDPLEQRVDFFLTTRSWSGEPEVREPHKCSAIGWYRPSALPEPMVPHERKLLGLLATGEVPPVVTFGY
jgi:8-oxo-dGTP diphosphatase